MFHFSGRRVSGTAPAEAPAEDARTGSRRSGRRLALRASITDAAFARRLAMTVAAVCGVIVAWRLRHVELLLFGAILSGVFFNAVADPIRRRLRIADGWALALAVVLFVVVLGGALLFFGVRLQAQAVDLTRSLPQAWARFKADVGGTPLGSLVIHALEQLGREGVGKIGPRLRGYAVTTGAALLGILLVLVAGIYLAARPEPYRRGVLRLIPARRRPKFEQFLDITGELLRRWLLAEAAAMISIGVMTGVGLWAIGVPSPAALGVLAAIGEFVPMVGVLVASAPAVLLAAMHSWSTVIWTVVVLTAIHQFDGNIVQPFLQRGFNSVPPVTTLFALVGFGSFLGLLGLIFAIPLTLVCLAAAQVWLGQDQTVEAGGPT